MRCDVIVPTPATAPDLFLGRTLAAHWRALCDLARLSSGDGPGPYIAIDGRFAALDPGTLRALAVPGALQAPDGQVVAVADSDPERARQLAVDGHPVTVIGADEAHPIDDPWRRAAAERAVVNRHLRALVAAGVRVVDPARIWVEPTVTVQEGAVLWGGCTLRGNTHVAADAEIQSGSWLVDTTVGARSVIRPHTVCEGAVIGPDCAVGPSAHLRAGAELADDVKVGNFVEVKQARLHTGVRASHLTYLGDAEVGAGANIGAGTITCNYDGFGKHRTVIGAGAFVGSNSALVAPVRIGAGAIVGAGSTIGSDVPDEALVVERAQTRTFEDRAPTLRARNRKRAAPRE